MEKLVPLFNQLQEILNKANLNNSIQLPQIVAVGAQSTGKSSVLESILGKDLLPRGSGIVTRRPIILQLNHTSKQEEYVEFGHKKGERFIDWHKARKELEDEMNRVAGENKGISSEAIIVRMFSPTIVNLTIVDLPGITKIPVGDQPKDIEKQVYNMIMSYIKNPNTIILAVSPANVDLANSDSLKLAREVDPEGNRTLGVITKLDLLEEGSHCLDALEGKLYRLKLGYVGVVGRSQKDLENKKSVHEALEAEKNFFQNHKFYSKFHERMGIDFLTKELSSQFLKSIKRTLPSISESLHRLIQETETEMARNGDMEIDPENKDSRGQLVLSIISRFARVYIEILSGNYSYGATRELFGGARINYILYEVFNKSVDELDPLKSLSDERIRAAIRNANGIEPCIFLPESAFENLVKQQILRLKPPAFECVFFIYEELRKILHSVEIPGLSRFYNLKVEIYNIIEGILNCYYSETKEMILSLINIELGFINTSHPDFIGGINLLFDMVQEKKPSQEAQEKQTWNFEELGKLILEKIGLEKEEEPTIKEIFLDQLSDDEEEDESVPTNNMNNINKVKEQEAFQESMKNFDRLTQDEKPTFEKIQNSSLVLKEPKITSQIKKVQMVQGPLYELYHVTDFSPIKLPEVQTKIKLEGEPTQKEQIEINLIKKLVASYFNVVRKNIDDSIIKTIVTFLINKLKNECEKELVKKLYKEESYERLLSEDLITMEQRKERREKMVFLRRCANIISEMEFKL